MNDSVRVNKGQEQWELSYNFSGSKNWYSDFGAQFGNIWLEENEQLKYFQQTKNKV